ncbi:MAG TPA: acetyl/propionyl/methylcrotonyl-CoA carboxylase subunit alpha [Casimicrobiaceae bacterium]|nr:acetyl/propionyl/methylcrotonyl-CoA carboxylase subunit alpha [Casimicrobiaceae bacterium]
MFNKILIANRGEIACRIAATARRLGVRTVAVYSDVDAKSLHVTVCDEAIRIGAAAPRASYLNGAAILDAAKRSGAQAIHPGYGFLSENETFAADCANAGVVFIGPPPAAIAAMGSKSAAKAIMARAGVPVVPGYHDDDQDPALLAREAARIGFPVLIKATAGGGGKGMKVAASAAEFASALASAQREAKASFGDDRMLVERYLRTPRHIEIQVFADTHGNVVHLFERDCSIQRRHQKVLEEAPAPGMEVARRRAMGDAATAAAKAIGYVGAGTVEFIAEQDGTFYFMEMNTRLQVEHPVTEMITGLDLVEWQLRVAAGEPLPVEQSALKIRGHAIEARIYAEDPARGFLPSIGTITHWRMPVDADNVRIDTGFREGDDVSRFYDPLLAKVIAWGEDRERARMTLLHALDASEVTGVTTNISFVARVVAHPSFASGHLDTGLIETNREALFAPAGAAPERALIAAALSEYQAIERAALAVSPNAADRYSPWRLADTWWNGTTTHHINVVLADDAGQRSVIMRPNANGSVTLGGDVAPLAARAETRAGRLFVAAERDGTPDVDASFAAAVVRDGDVLHVFGSRSRALLTRIDPLAHADDEPAHGGHLTAPMSGTVVAVLVKPGDTVDKGAPLIVLEAMKMEHTITAPAAGKIAAVNYGIGDRVAEGAYLVDVDDATDTNVQAQ